MGFCIFNNVTVGANYLIEKYNYKKIAIIDFDVHHGNGTQIYFTRIKKFLYISTHQLSHYPGQVLSHEKGSHNNIFKYSFNSRNRFKEFLNAYEHVLKN